MINLSRTNFHDNELNLINKGFKHNIQPVKSQALFENLGLETELVLKQVDNNIGLKYTTTKLIKNEYYNYEQNLQIKNTVDSIKEYISRDDLVFTKADKGNTVVVLNKDLYNLRTLDFLETQSLTTLDKDPTPTFQKDVKAVLANIRISIKDQD